MTDLLERIEAVRSAVLGPPSFQQLELELRLIRLGCARRELSEKVKGWSIPSSVIALVICAYCRTARTSRLHSCRSCGASEVLGA